MNATGRPIFANDLHRAHGRPSLRYVAHLSAPDMDVIGAGEPFLPGISIGHNDAITFGLTRIYMDQEDLYVYETNPAAPNEYRYRAAAKADDHRDGADHGQGRAGAADRDKRTITRLNEPIPDETTILNFRHLLEANDLAEDILKSINALLARKGLLLKQGSIVDATIIAAPSSTKNAEGERDPEMHQTKKGNQWFFGMKAHIGVDADSGLVHSVTTTAANEADVEQVADLLHGTEEHVWADSGSRGAPSRVDRNDLQWHIAARPSDIAKLPEGRAKAKLQKAEHRKASVRAKVEHPFRVIKRQFGLVKVRFRGLAKNTAHVVTLFALSNLWMVRKQLIASAGAVRPKTA